VAATAAAVGKAASVVSGGVVAARKVLGGTIKGRVSSGKFFVLGRNEKT
jgi:hypothetical protein